MLSSVVKDAEVFRSGPIYIFSGFASPITHCATRGPEAADGCSDTPAKLTYCTTLAGARVIKRGRWPSAGCCSGMKLLKHACDTHSLFISIITIIYLHRRAGV